MCNKSDAKTVVLKQFISDDGWFSLFIPSEWKEYDENGDGTYSFFDAKSKTWKGNFRITPMRFPRSQQRRMKRENSLLMN